jgi:hypothetical protein
MRNQVLDANAATPMQMLHAEGSATAAQIIPQNTGIDPRIKKICRFGMAYLTGIALIAIFNQWRVWRDDMRLGP